MVITMKENGVNTYCSGIRGMDESEKIACQMKIIIKDGKITYSNWSGGIPGLNGGCGEIDNKDTIITITEYEKEVADEDNS